MRVEVEHVAGPDDPGGRAHVHHGGKSILTGHDTAVT
jgi:hypothetical protein